MARPFNILMGVAAIVMEHEEEEEEEEEEERQWRNVLNRGDGG